MNDCKHAVFRALEWVFWDPCAILYTHTSSHSTSSSVVMQDLHQNVAHSNSKARKSHSPLHAWFISLSFKYHCIPLLLNYLSIL